MASKTTLNCSSCLSSSASNLCFSESIETLCPVKACGRERRPPQLDITGSQVAELLRRELEHEVRGGTVPVAPDGLNQRPSLHAVEHGKVLIEHHLVATERSNSLDDPLRRDVLFRFLGGAHGFSLPFTRYAWRGCVVRSG